METPPGAITMMLCNLLGNMNGPWAVNQCKAGIYYLGYFLITAEEGLSMYVLEIAILLFFQ